MYQFVLDIQLVSSALPDNSSISHTQGPEPKIWPGSGLKIQELVKHHMEVNPQESHTANINGCYPYQNC